MAAVDSLLRILTVRNAELLVLATGEVPVLRKGGEAQPLSMPPLDAALVATFVADVLDDVARARIASAGSAEVSHRADDGSWFALLVEARGAGHRMSCRPGVAPKAAAAPKPPPRNAPPAPPRAWGDLLDHDARASDVFLSTGQPPRMRIDGELTELGAIASTEAEILELCGADDTHRRDLDAHGSVDLALTRGGRRYRVNLFHHRGGLAATLRPIRGDAPALEALHLPPELASLTQHTSGLVLVTGRAGSGKSTTLSALIDHINRTRARHVITLEDPVEHEYAPRRALIHQREVGRDVPDFATGLRAALRESPDVILLGEMRDRETIAAALTAAETGHLVLSTLHCAGAANAVDRIVDSFPEAQQGQVRLQLASTLRAVLSQVLVPAQGGGRLPAHELLVVTSGVAAQIREAKGHQLASAIQTGRDAGMVPLERTLATLVKTGKVSKAAARDAANDPAALDELLR